MKISRIPVFCLVVAMVLVDARAWSGDAAPEAASRDTVAGAFEKALECQEAITQIVKTITDDESAKAAGPKLTAAYLNWWTARDAIMPAMAAFAKAQGLSEKSSQEEKKAFEDKMKLGPEQEARFEAAEKQYGKEFGRIARNPVWKAIGDEAEKAALKALEAKRAGTKSGG